MIASSATVTIRTVSTTVRHMRRSVMCHDTACAVAAARSAKTFIRFPLQVDHAGETDRGAPGSSAEAFRPTGFPFTAVPNWLTSSIVKRPVSASRRMRQCSRDTSGRVSSLTIHPVRSAAASDHHLVLRHLECLLPVLIRITEIRKGAAFCLLGFIVFSVLGRLRVRTCAVATRCGGSAVGVRRFSAFLGKMRRVSEPAPYSAFCGAPNSE